MRATSVAFTLFVALTVSSFVCSTVLSAQDGAAFSSGSPAIINERPLIADPIDEARLTTLKGNVHPLARLEFDLGTASADLPMQRMLLVLKRSSEQEFALRKLLDDQQDKNSPNYHKWLTPQHFGKQFGPTDADIHAVTAWLQSHGFQVSPTKGRTAMEVSGYASQVQEAFHTAIHKYVVNGEQHWANATDPAIPAALAPAVAGIFTLHNFVKRPHVHLSAQPMAATIPAGKRPHITFSDGTHGLGPWDYAAIYNNAYLLNTGTAGTGVTVGVIGRAISTMQPGPPPMCLSSVPFLVWRRRILESS